MDQFQDWYNNCPIAVRGQNTVTLMRMAYNAALEACAGLAAKTALENKEDDVAPKSAEQACSLMCKEIRGAIGKGVM